MSPNWFRSRRAADASAQEIEPAPVYVIGRSGGTIFLEALSRHPEIVVCERWPHEQRPVSYLIEARDALAIRDAPAADARSLYENRRSPFSSREPEDERLFRERCLEPLDATVRTAAASFYRALAARQDKPRARWFVEKASDRWLDGLLDRFEGARPIFHVRDPRDAALSAADFMPRKRGEESPGTEREVVNQASGDYGGAWRNLPRVIERVRARRVPLLVVKYEDLLREPAKSLERVAEFLEIARDGIAAMARAYAEPPQKQDHLTAPSPAASIGRWRRDLSTATRQELERMLGGVARELGYD